MFGALMGDVIGSVYESGERQCADPEHVVLWSSEGMFSDDSVLTAAISEWCRLGGSLGAILHAWGGRHLGRGYGNNFLQWLMATTPPPAYGSWGNGAAMRVSPIALWADDEADLMALASASAMPTHDHPQGIRGAQAAAWATRHAFEHHDRHRLLAEVEEKFGYRLRAFDPIGVKNAGFQIECEATVISAVWCACHGESLEHTLRLVLALGGDTDTVGAIAGAIAEGLYGLPENGLDKLAPYFENGTDVWAAMIAFYNHPKIHERLVQWGRVPHFLPPALA